MTGEGSVSLLLLLLLHVLALQPAVSVPATVPSEAGAGLQERTATLTADTSGEEGSHAADRPVPDMWWAEPDRGRDVEVRELSTVQLSCRVHRLSPLTPCTVRWTKDGQPLAKSSRVRKKLFALRVDDLMLGDSGNYTCTLTSPTTRLSCSFRVLVSPAKVSHVPLISQGPVNVTVEEGGRVELGCEVHPDSLESFVLLQWIQHHLINGSYVDHNGQPYVTVVKASEDSRENPWRLVLQNVTGSEEGWYSCVVKNSLGYEYQSAFLHVISREDRLRAAEARDRGEHDYDPLEDSNPGLLMMGGVAGLVVLIIVVTVAFVWQRCLCCLCSYAIMSRCWQRKPGDRPDFSQLVCLIDPLLMASLSDEAYLDVTEYVLPDRPRSPSC